jgi:iron complex transport system substrate-binding protein
VIGPRGAALAGEVRVTDDLGQEVALPGPARRIIALYGAYNEILAAMGLEERLVGRTKADVLPPSILEKPSIGTHMRPNVEMILGLKPDLIIQSAGRREALTVVHQLQKRGFRIPIFNPSGFQDLFSVITRLGILTGEPDRAAELVSSLMAGLSAVEENLEGLGHRPRVFFEVRYPNLLAAGRGSIVNEIIARAGGVNCVSNPKKLVRIGTEALIESNPEVYVIQRGPMNKDPSPPDRRPHFQVLGAVREGRTLVVDEQMYSRPGPRSVKAVQELAAFLHPERF